MISRADLLPRFGSFLRHITKSSTLTKQNVSKYEQVSADKVSKKSFKKPESQTEPASALDDLEKTKKEMKKLNKKASPDSVQMKNLFQNFESKIVKESGFKMKERSEFKTVNFENLDPFLKDSYDVIMKKMQQNSSSVKDLIPICLQLEELADKEAKIVALYNSDAMKKTINNVLTKNLEMMEIEQFFNAIYFLIRFEPSLFTSLEAYIESNYSNFDSYQALRILSVLRRASVNNFVKPDQLKKYTELALDKVSQIDNYKSLELAMKLFAPKTKFHQTDQELKKQDTLNVKKIDDRIMKISDKLECNDWIDLFKTKSILRLRNLNLLEACSFNIIKKCGDNSLSLEQIQTLLLSCGILSFTNEQFYKFLIDKLLEVIKANLNNSDWLKHNETNLLPIINSIGILKLNDKNLLDTLCLFLSQNQLSSNKLATHFVVSCACLDYKPNEQSFKALRDKLSLNSFKTVERLDKIALLDYVWSLCVLDSASSEFVAAVLKESFWNDLIAFHKTRVDLLKPILLKLFNINLYSILFMDEYDGPTLPETINAAEFSYALAPNLSTKNLNDIFVTTMSSYRSLDTYIKLNLLTPFGILIDALMVTDKNGIPQRLESYFKNGELETKEDEIKVAIKFASYFDFNHVNKNLKGIFSFQLKLLENLGYKTLVVTQEELQSTTLVNRVSLISNKLKDLAKKQN